MVNSVRVLLADAHPLVREGLRVVLRRQDGITLVGEAATADEICSLTARQRPDILVLDLSIPGLSPFETVNYIRTQWPTVQIVILTAHNAPMYAHQLMALGVVGYVLKDDPLEAVVDAIRIVASGGTWFSRRVVAKLVPTSDELPLPNLTARERELLSLLIKGWDTSRLAQTLGVTKPTLRNYLSRVYAKIGVHTRVEAMVWASKHGYLQSAFILLALESIVRMMPLANLT